MIVDDPLCVIPDNGSKIWRYVDFAKFAALLDTSSLWFARLDCLGDDYEGVMSVRAALT